MAPRSGLLADDLAWALALGLALCLAVSLGCRSETGEVPVDPEGWIDEIDELTPETRAMLQRVMVPQPTPERCLRLELALLRRGFYYRDVTMYDEAWRRPDETTSPSRRLMADAREWEGTVIVKQVGDHAIGYYPGEKGKTVGPRFLRLTEAGWILETSLVNKNIIYGPGGRWAAVDGDYPYLSILRSVYDMEAVTLIESGRAWAIR